MQQIIISGADGFIGRHLCKALSDKGYAITALIIHNSPLRNTISEIPNLQIIENDFSEAELKNANLPLSPLAFIHLAWAGVSPDKRDSLDIQSNNIHLALNAVKTAARINAQKFILPGSTMEYMYNKQPICGEDVPTPQNIYGATKVAVRYLSEALAAQLKLPFIYTVFTGVYSADRRDNNVIYYVIDCLLSGVSPCLTKLEQRWDYVHIDDLTGALTAICERGIPGRCYPIGHGDNMPLADYIETIHHIIAPEIPLKLGEIPYTKSELPQSCVNLDALINDTGYKPSIPFDEGIIQVIDQVKQERAQ